MVAGAQGPKTLAGERGEVELQTAGLWKVRCALSMDGRRRPGAEELLAAQERDGASVSERLSGWREEQQLVTGSSESYALGT